MKIFKKTLVIAMVLCLALGCLAAQAVTELTESTEATAQTQVVLDLGEQPTSYTIVIPSQVTIDPDTGKGNGTITLKSGFVLTDVTSLKVRMTGGYTEGHFSQGQGGGASTTYEAYMMLKNTENDSQLRCEIYHQGTESLKYTTDLISVTNQTSNTEDKSHTLRFNVTNDLPSYGKYTGTLTFSVVTA